MARAKGAAQLAVRSYFQAGRVEGPKLKRLISRIADFEIIVTDSEMEALILEMNLVKEYKPRYNVNLKDDKSFPYIRVTNEPYPRIFPTLRSCDKPLCFRAYRCVTNALAKTIGRIFPIRSCNYDINEETIRKGKYKVCLDYHIKKCDGPCEGLISEEEYRQIVNQVVNFINGRDQLVVQELTEKMKDLAARRKFEEAARIRDRIKFIENFQYKQKVVTDDFMDRDVVAVALEDEDACGVIFKIREGKIIGRQHYCILWRCVSEA
ncbi:MAG: UvrB/UvrC motif-containing protein [candidate division KSB1 bacterium]|nr:UvrB/UvrC motif-containing protein [candidate division KSB1 bacterium]